MITTETTGGATPAGSPRESDGEGASRSALPVAAFVTSLVGFLICWFPFAGFIGLVGLTMGGAALRYRYRRGFSVTAVILGTLATLAALIWVYAAVVVSCPRIYSWDGAAWRLDGDVLTGSLFRGGEGEDMDRLEHILPHEGRYRIRVANDLEEVDHIDQLSLLVVDHPGEKVALPTQEGQILLLGKASPPGRALDSRGETQLPLLLHDDGRAYQGLPGGKVLPEGLPPLEVLHLEFPDPGPGPQALVLRGRVMEEATRAFTEYLATMGPGLGALLEYVQDCEDYPFKERLHDEMARLGLMMDVRQRVGGEWVPITTVRPIGPAVWRHQAIPLAPHEGGHPLEVELRLTPLVWELDRVSVAPFREAKPIVLTPMGALDREGRDRLKPLLHADGARLTLHQGEWAEVVFRAPPPGEEGVRTVLVKARGYYSFQIGGRGWIDPLAILGHRSGGRSFPEFLHRRQGGQR